MHLLYSEQKMFSSYKARGHHEQNRRNLQFKEREVEKTKGLYLFIYLFFFFFFGGGGGGGGEFSLIKCNFQRFERQLGVLCYMHVSS